MVDFCKISARVMLRDLLHSHLMNEAAEGESGQGVPFPVQVALPNRWPPIEFLIEALVEKKHAPHQKAGGENHLNIETKLFS